MCGIVGFTGSTPCKDILLTGLSLLEYRGYDSAGIAILDGARGMDVFRVKGRVEGLVKLVGNTPLFGTTGIGHTRWATHGKPSEVNAHPHRDCTGKIAIVHNGIIENFSELRTQLIEQGHVFISETDSEVIAHLLERAYEGDMRVAMTETIAQLEGAYTIVAVHADHPDEIVAVRKSSPLVVGSAEGCAVVASDTPALIEVTRDVVFPDDGVVCVLHSGGTVDYFDGDGVPVSPETVHIDWSIDEAKLGGYEDFMDKEIAEQPRVVRDTLAGRVKDGRVIIDELALTAEDIAAIDRVYIIACGTSYHAGLIAKNLIEAWSRIPCDVEVASEFRYRDPIVSPSTLVIAVSQSGETADTVEAVQLARTHGARVFAITNSVGSRITRESDGVIYAQAGPETCVAATKSFLAQVVALTLVALYLGQARGHLTCAQVRMFYREMQRLPEQITAILDDTTSIEHAAEIIDGATSALFIGRGIGATTCYEGALKLKEISYVHAEAFAAGEIKHGPIALVDEAMPVVALMIKSATRDKMVSNIAEVRARGAKVIGIATQGDPDAEHICDEVIYIPAVRECFSAITASVVLQVLARCVAKTRGCDVDKPRNLAKSVTVE